MLKKSDRSISYPTRMAGSDFARKQLQKHGWKEGAGLGKQEDGRAEPIKVSLKMDKTGVGHDPGKEFTDHWWLRVFNEAAQKIGKNKKDKSSSNEKEKHLSKMAEKKKNFYKGFVKSSTLTNGVEEKDGSSDLSSEDERSEENKESLPTLDDIHKFCGGATGHRAARFGIKMKGKLSRVAEHDQQFQEKLKKHKTDSARLSGDPSMVVGLPKVSGEGEVVDQTSQLDSQALEQPPGYNEGKRRKKKKKKKIDKDEHCLQDIHVDGGGTMDCENAKTKMCSNTEVVNFHDEHGDRTSQKNKRKRKKDKESPDTSDIKSKKEDEADGRNSLISTNKDSDGSGGKSSKKLKHSKESVEKEHFQTESTGHRSKKEVHAADNTVLKKKKKKKRKDEL